MVDCGGVSADPGISLRPDGAQYFPPEAAAGLIGVATVPGIYNFTLRVRVLGLDADQACTIKITTLTNLTAQAPDAFVGVPYLVHRWSPAEIRGRTWTAVGAEAPLPAG